MWAAALPLNVSKRWAGDRRKTYLDILGFGLIACIANSDIGGLLTMAVSGSRLGYFLLPLQPLLASVFYMAQELAVRLGSCSHRSLSGLAFDHLGPVVGCLALVVCLLLGSMAIVSEFTGLALIGELWGISRWVSSAMSAALLSAVVLTGRFSMAGRIGLVLALSLAVFLVLGFICRPGSGEVGAALTSLESGNHFKDFPYLFAASAGSVVTPWMFFYQLSASVEKRIVPSDLKLARIDTAAGTICTQAIMFSVLITFARLAHGADMEKMSVHEALVKPLHPVLGKFWGNVVMTVGLLGSSLLATLVVTLGVAKNCADTLGARGASPFLWRLGILFPVACGAVLVGFNLVNIVLLNMKIQVLNGLMMPIIVGIMFYLARSDALPPSLRLQGTYAFVSGGAFTVCALAVGICAML